MDNKPLNHLISLNLLYNRIINVDAALEEFPVQTKSMTVAGGMNQSILLCHNLNKEIKNE